MPRKISFTDKLESKVKQQIRGARVGFLLGAGSSYLNGDGYPLANDLWNCINAQIPEPQRTEIQNKLDEGADGLEQALDLLDEGQVQEGPHRHTVTNAIANHFAKLNPPPEVHGSFLSRLSHRNAKSIPIFSLNYDPLIERASESYLLRCEDGFIGVEHAYFDPAIFQQHTVVITRGAKGLQSRPVNGILKLYKLHGSLGWYQCPTGEIKRCVFHENIPKDAKRLMVPPQHRKATDTTAQPFASIWSEFRQMLAQGPVLINRLVSVGYGMHDEHVNAVIENALPRSNFTLIILARELTDDAFLRWSARKNTILVTRERCSIYGTVGPGDEKFWSFEWLSGEV